MNATLRLQAIARRPGAVLSSNALRRPAQWRRFSTAIPTPDNLPLAGVRVLDMTRVLAGVSVDSLLAVFGTITLTVQPYCTQILGDLGYASLRCWRLPG